MHDFSRRLPDCGGIRCPCHKPSVLKFSAGQEVLQKAGPLIKALYEVSTLLRTHEAASSGSQPVLAFLADLRTELARLLRRTFSSLTTKSDSAHRTVSPRRGHPRGTGHRPSGKGPLRGKEIDGLIQRHQDLGPDLPSFATEEKRGEIDEFGWMLDEYRISLSCARAQRRLSRFAQAP